MGKYQTALKKLQRRAQMQDLGMSQVKEEIKDRVESKKWVKKRKDLTKKYEGEKKALIDEKKDIRNMRSATSKKIKGVEKQISAKKKASKQRVDKFHKKFSSLEKAFVPRGKILNRPTASLQTISSKELLKSFARGNRQLSQPQNIEEAKRRSVFFRSEFEGEKDKESMWLRGGIL